MIIPFPAQIKCKVIDLLLNRYPPCTRFLFEQDEQEQCQVQLPNEYPDWGPWLFDRVQEILATDLTDGDGEDAWFRYKGFLIFYPERGHTFRYQVYTDETPLRRYEFDVRDLLPYGSGSTVNHEQTIRAAIESGQIALDSPLLTIISDLQEGKKERRKEGRKE